jgi:UDP-N-acetylmuramyl pentapeptide phosphotransferase/UDP-N-acetylglucosamine-1-phosphate transferase
MVSIGSSPVIGAALAAVAVFLLSRELTSRLSTTSSPFDVLDLPNDRSLHSVPTPRTGGLAVVGSLTAGLLIVPLIALLPDFRGHPTARLLPSWPIPLLWIMALTLALAAISYLDDRLNLPACSRLLFHLVIATAAVLLGRLTLDRIPVPVIGDLPVGNIAVPIAVLLLVWMINLFNFMDGMDGFAGGMAVIGFGALGISSWIAGDAALATIALLVVAAAGGFLLFNRPPARIFLGDVGSTSLGFLAGALALLGTARGDFAIWQPLLVFSPFIVDATVTLLRRALRGERVWQAHRSHYYQRLVLAGWSHGRTVAAEYALMLACGASTLAYRALSESGRLALLVGWAAVYVLLARAVRAVERLRGVPGARP